MFKIILLTLFLIPSLSDAQTPASMRGRKPKYVDSDNSYSPPKNTIKYEAQNEQYSVKEEVEQKQNNEDVFSPITEAENALFEDALPIENGIEENLENQQIVEKSEISKSDPSQIKDSKKTVEDSGKMLILELDSNPWLQENEPSKTENNLLRIKYSKLDYDLQDADITAINSMLNLVEDEKLEEIVIKSYSSKAKNERTEMQNGLIRILKIRNILQKQDYDLSNIKYKVFNSANNKFDLDYIDIDKI